jgi:serine/threonine protein kinase/tetratricopeptide (TPR) repeat protein
MTDRSDDLDTRTVSDRDEPAAARRPMPETIGEYRVVGLLGEGGMGVVWEAEQQQPRRRVAVKVMRQARIHDPGQARLFEREVEILGRLKHPNIAAIYAAGQTGDGHGFFAMELVRGETLDRWILGRPAPVTRAELALRLRIFQRICDALNYAHQRGVVHRDLKPSNIVVTREASDTGASTGAALPVVKILDFGVARIADAETPGAALLTQAGMVRGTPQYMSPEQARGEIDSLDARTDVYALGLVLYEMLTGKTPYEISGLPTSDRLRAICETAPRPLRAAWSGSVRLDADLETIVGKALEKEQDRRYPSAAALAEDIERYLTSQPIVARAPSRAYQARKFVQRHRVGVGVAGGLLLTLVVFAASTTVQARRVARERDRANREAAAFKRVADFMVEMFKVSDPGEARGNSVTAREILDQASKQIDGGLAQDPELQARLLGTMGSVYRELGLYAQAAPLIDRAFENDRRTLGPENPETLRAMLDVVIVHAQQGKYEEAEKLGTDLLERQRRVLGPDHPDLVRTLNTVALAAWYQGRLDRAEPLFGQALALSRRVRGPEHLDTLGTMNNMGLVYMDEGKLPEAEKVFRDTLEIRRRISGPDHPLVLSAMLNLAMVERYQGRLQEAEKLARETLDLRRRVSGPDHPDTLQTLRVLALIKEEQGQFQEAEKLMREDLAAYTHVLGPDHPETILSRNEVANLCDVQGRHAEAVTIYREVLAARLRVLGPENGETLRTRVDMAEALRGERQFAESEKLLTGTLVVQRRVLGANHPDVGLTLYQLACTTAGLGDKERALSLLGEALDHGLVPTEARRMASDPALQSLHGDPRFAALAARIAAQKDS